MPQKIVINSESTGKYAIENINGREMLKTSMVSIVGDSVMNNLAYPYSEVLATYTQLNNLLAPAGHPKVDGINVSAFLPTAINAFNVGAYVSNPRMDNKKVINDLIIDLEVANKDERGIKIVQKIQNGEKVGVSTGLNATIKKQPGIMNGQEYAGIVSEIEYDHVAFLLDELPAGEGTYTLNNDVTICNISDSLSEFEKQCRDAVNTRYGSNAWMVDALFNEKRLIVEVDDAFLSVQFSYNQDNQVVLNGAAVPVKRKVTYEQTTVNNLIENQKVNDMDTEAFILKLIALNSKLSESDKARMIGMSEIALAEHITNALTITMDDATTLVTSQGLFINNVNSDDAAEFLANRTAFNAFLQSKEENKNKIIDKIVANSKMTKEQLLTMSEETLNALNESIVETTKPDYGIKGAVVTNAGNPSTVKLAEGA